MDDLSLGLGASIGHCGPEANQELSLTGGLQSRGARYFCWDLLFVPFRTQANEAQTDPPIKVTTLVFGSNDLPEGPPRPPRARGARHPCPEDPPPTPQ